MKSMNPHIVFAGNAREAFGFYRSIFGGELEVILVGDRDHDGLPPDAVYHADLQGDNFRIMGADGNASDRDGFSMHLQCEDKAELESLFQALSDHGTVHCSVCEAFGGWYGQVTDQFGIQWFLTCSA